MSTWLPLATLSLVLILIAVRRLGSLRLAIWQIMLGGALVVVLGGGIRPMDAWAAIDWEVIAYLFGVFLIGRAMVSSGWLFTMSTRMFGAILSADGLLLGVLFASGIASAVLMNDTLAVIGTPLMLILARAHRLPAELLLLALAFGVTIGSAMSPIGNPQNLLIAIQGEFSSPFLDFFLSLGPPSLINLGLTYALLKLYYRREVHGEVLVHPPANVSDRRFGRLAGLCFWLLVALSGLRILVSVLAPTWSFPLVWIALGAATPLLWLPTGRLRLVREIDWPTLIFFAAMFVLMRSVWDTGLIQSWLPARTPGVGEILVASVLGSQLISNVPLVALALPLLPSQDTGLLLALAAGSTIAGNLSLTGAASNVIIVQNAERHGASLSFWLFLKLGLPLTLINLGVYHLWLVWLA